MGEASRNIGREHSLKYLNLNNFCNNHIIYITEIYALTHKYSDTLILLQLCNAVFLSKALIKCSLHGFSKHKIVQNVLYGLYPAVHKSHQNTDATVPS